MVRHPQRASLQRRRLLGLVVALRDKSVRRVGKDAVRCLLRSDHDQQPSWKFVVVGKFVVVDGKHFLECMANFLMTSYSLPYLVDLCHTFDNLAFELLRDS